MLKNSTMKLRELCNVLEEWAPLAYQESYDNSGLITGNPEQELTGVLVSLDCIETVVEEAIQNNCNVIVSHHPILFKGIKSLTGNNYVERTLLKAIKNDIALYAIHTNLDNIISGVSKKMADCIGLENVEILSPKQGLLKKLVTYVPIEKADQVREALFGIGAGAMGNYTECNFSSQGFGTFKGTDDSNPVIGNKGVRETVNEERIELLYPKYIEAKLISTLKSAHPYEEVAYQTIFIDNENQTVGSGVIGDLTQEVSELDFLKSLKEDFKTSCVRHTSLLGKKIKKVALCGGAGSFLLEVAKRRKADVFITADFKYHEFFDAENKVLVADIGHYESEQYTINLIADFLRENFPRFAVRLSKVNTNPINYL